MKRFTLPSAEFQHLVAVYLPRGAAPYYLKRFEDLERGHHLFSFNLAAAFWSFFWFWYHKMYLVGFVVMMLFLGVDAGLEAILSPLCLSSAVEGTLRFFGPMAISAVTVGMCADALYWYHCRVKIERLWKKFGGNGHGAVLQEKLAAQGGTNLRGTAWGVGLVFALLFGVFGWLYQQDPEAAKRIMMDAIVTEHHQAGCSEGHE